MASASRIREIFDGALERTGDARRAFLDGACVGDASLRANVDALIAAAESEDAFLSQPTAGAVAAEAAETIAAPIREGPGTRIGPYKLLQLIGEGGFGSVFMAQQEQPVQRKVALKIIKLGMDTRQVVARFEQERQALALMDHPNIARVLDAGATETGRPYFVMELVKGDPIVEYADKNNLAIEDRLELFAQVCNAVQHAHTKGIIHRDIKPSNILVSTQDGRPHTKVIDFGIAKATASQLTEKTLFTEHRQLIGTPEYMSPEQAEGNLDIDTRTDVYSLGVLLYELLTGTTPFSSKELRSAAYAEIQRIIREVEPPKPSTRLSSNTDTIANVAAKRHTEPKRLGTMVRGDLDWIVMKALEKDRQRRYETANGLAMDIRRYLSGEAVVAAPPSHAYRLKKFVRRNKGQVIAASLVLLALVAGVVGTTIGLIEAKKQERVAIAAAEEERKAKEREAQRAEGERLAKLDAEAKKAEAEAEKQRADEEKQIAESVTEFLTQKLLAQADAGTQADSLLQAGELASEAKPNPTIRELLDRAATQLAPDKIEANFPNQPAVQTRILKTVGDTYVGIGQASTAIPLLTRSLELCKATFGIDDRRTLNTMHNLASAYQNAGQLDEAVHMFEKGLALTKASLGSDHDETSIGTESLALAYRHAGQEDKAVPLYEEVLSVKKAKFGPNDQRTLNTMINLAVAYESTGQFSKALPLFEEAVTLMKAHLGLDPPCTRPFRSVGGPLSGCADGCAIDTGCSRGRTKTAFSGPPAGYKYSSPARRALRRGSRAAQPGRSGHDRSAPNCGRARQSHESGK